MAHVSGYVGTITFTGTMGDDVWKGGNSLSALKVTEWSINMTSGSFEAAAKSDPWVTTFTIGAEWTSTCTFLFQDSWGTNDSEALVRAATFTIKKAQIAFVSSGDSWTAQTANGYAIVKNMKVNDPLDAPVTMTVELEGEGPLLFTAG